MKESKVLLNMKSGDQDIQLAYPFTGIAGKSDDNEVCFNKICTKLISAVKQGFNALLIAYGQTGCGKTYTMLGKPRNDPPVLGLLPKAIEVLFADKPSPRIFLSYLVSYGLKANDIKIYDLLDDKNSNAVCAKKHGRFEMPGDLTADRGNKYTELWPFKSGKGNFDPLKAQRIELKDPIHGAEKVNLYQQRSHFAPTGKNPDSSRGHTTILLRVEPHNDPSSHEIIDPATFLFVDLAGSEGDTAITPKFVAESDPDTVLTRKLEAGTINKGLTQLKRIFADLRNQGKVSSGERTGLKRILFPYIDTKSALTCMFMMSPAAGNATSTNSTLLFAKDAAAIKVKPVKPKSRVNWKAVYLELEKKFKDLQEGGISTGGGMLGTVKAPKKPVYLFAGIDANSVKLMKDEDFKKMKDEAKDKASAKSFSVADIEAGKVKLGEHLEDEDPWDGPDRDDDIIMEMQPELLNHSELVTRVQTLLAQKEKSEFLVIEQRKTKDSQLEYYGQKAQELNEHIRKFAGKHKGKKDKKKKLSFGK